MVTDTSGINYGSLETNILFENALFLAHCSKAAYENDLVPYFTNLGIPIDNLFQFEDENLDTAGFAVKAGNHVIVAFRGTSSIQNLTTDMSLAHKKACNGRVHSGFDNAAVGVMDLLINALESLIENNETVWFTGHSLGGAVALLAAKRIVSKVEDGMSQKYIPSQIITFGSPKVGDTGFAARCPLHNKLIPIVNTDDLVPYMPPIIGWDYAHVHGAYHYRLAKDHWKQVKLDPSMRKALLKQCRKQWLKLNSVVLHGTATHSIVRYIDYLGNNLASSPLHNA